MIATLRAFILPAMNAIADPRLRQWPQLSFLLWGWGMLLVVLLSAAPTGGQVRTRLVGSAFDPATVSVAVSPKKPKAKALAQSSVRGVPAAHADDPPPRSGDASLLALPPSVLVEPAPLPEPSPGTLVPVGLSPKAHRARAPPIA